MAYCHFDLFLLTNSRRQRKERLSYLIKKVYETDSLTCPKCKGKMRIIGFFDQPEFDLPFGTSRLTSKTPGMGLTAQAWLTALCHCGGKASGHGRLENRSEPRFFFVLLSLSLFVLAGTPRLRRIVGDSNRLHNRHRLNSVMDTDGQFPRRLHPRKTLRRQCLRLRASCRPEQLRLNRLPEE